VCIFSAANGALLVQKKLGFTINKPPRRFAPAGLILIHRFPLSLFYSSTITAPITSPFVVPSLLYLGFLTVPFCPLFFLPPFPLSPPHLPFPSLPTLPIYAYNMPVQLLYRPAVHYYTGFATLATQCFRYRCSAKLTKKI